MTRRLDDAGVPLGPAAQRSAASPKTHVDGNRERSAHAADTASELMVERQPQRLRPSAGWPAGGSPGALPSGGLPPSGGPPRSGGLSPSGVPVSRPGDSGEREAHRAADAVLAARQGRGGVVPLLSAPPVADVGPFPGDSDAALVAGIGSPWAPLGAGARSFMEPRFGRDFSGVRVHAGPDAGASAHALGAVAYTVGRDIVVDERRADLDAESDRHLLAHELAHVVQQERLAGGRPAIVQRQAGTATKKSPPAQKPSTSAPAKPKRKVAVPDPLFPHEVQWQALFVEGQHLGEVLQATYPELGPIDRIIAIANAVHIAGGDGQLIGHYALRSRWRLPPGVYLMWPHQTQQLHVNLAATPIAVNRDDLPEDLLKRIEKKDQLDAADWIKAEPSVFDVDLMLLLVTDVATPGIQQATEDTDVDAPLEDDVGALEPGFGSEVGSTDPSQFKTAPLPPLSAEIVGLRDQPADGTGSYRMRIHWEETSPDWLIAASWASKPTSYGWQLWKIDKLKPLEVKRAEAQARRDTADKGEHIGVWDSYGHDSARRWHDLVDHADQYDKDRKQALQDGRVVDELSNELNQGLYSVEILHTVGSQIFDTVAKLFTDHREREVEWTRGPGFYILRCVSWVDPAGAKEGRKWRPPSVAAVVIHVQDLTRLSRESSGEGEASLAGAQALAKGLEQFDKEAGIDPATDQALLRATNQVKDLELAVGGSAEAVIRADYVRLKAAYEKARDSSVLIAHGFHDSEVSQLEREVDMLESTLKLAEKRAKQLSLDGTRAVRRVQATLVSRVSGQKYPLLIQVAEPRRVGKGPYETMISDVTTPDGGKAEGSHPTDPIQAVWAAFTDFAHHEGSESYGEGTLGVRLPVDFGPAEIPRLWRWQLTDEERIATFQVSPHDAKVAKQRLEELASILGILAVIAAPELALPGALIGGALAAAHIYERWKNDTLRADASLISDVLSILSALTATVSTLGKLTKVALPDGRFVLVVTEEGGTVATAAQSFDKWVLNPASVAWGNAQIVDALLAINAREDAGTLSSTDAARQRSELFVHGLGQNIGFIAHLRGPHGEGEEPVPEGGRPPAGRPGRTEPPVTEIDPRRPAPGREPPTTGREPGSGREPPTTREPTATGPERPIEDIPVIELPDDTVIYQDKSQPMTETEARDVLRNATADDSTREVAVLVDDLTGEYIVIQGSRGLVEDRARFNRAMAEYIRERGAAGRWRLREHFHPPDISGATPAEQRYPSARGGDFERARSDSTAAGNRPVEAALAFMTENGPQEIAYGYDPSRAKPYWLRWVDDHGDPHVEEFANLDAYGTWFRRRFGGSPDVAQGSGISAPGRSRPTRRPADPQRKTKRPAEEPSERGAPERVPGAGETPTRPEAEPNAREELTRRRSDVARRFDEADAAHADAEAEGPSATERFDGAMRAFEEKGVGAAGRGLAERIFQPAKGTRELSPTRFRQALDQFERLAGIVRERPDLLEPGGRGHWYQELLDLAHEVGREYLRRQDKPGQRGIPRERLEEANRALRQAFIEYNELTTEDPVARLEALLRLQDQVIGRTREVLRWLDPTFSSNTAIGALTESGDLAGLQEQPVDVTAAGNIGEPIRRDLPGVGLERYLLTPSEIAELHTEPPELAGQLAGLLRGYQRAHLVGPGFGGELFEGLMLAPEKMNLEAQNDGVEKFVRDSRAAGVEMSVDVHASGRRLVVPLAEGGIEHVDVLTRVEYDITGTLGDHPSQKYRVVIEVGPPPNGAVTVIESTIPADAPGGDVLQRLRPGSAAPGTPGAPAAP